MSRLAAWLREHRRVIVVEWLEPTLDRREPWELREIEIKPRAWRDALALARELRGDPTIQGVRIYSRRAATPSVRRWYDR